MLWKYFYIIQQKTFAFFLDICYHELVRGCGEMADAADSKSADGDIVRVRLPPSAWPILALNVWFNDVQSFFNVSPNARWDRGLVHVPELGHVPDPCPNHKNDRSPHIRAAVIFYPGAQVFPGARNVLIISGEYD